jgi:hypothetical protein
MHGIRHNVPRIKHDTVYYKYEEKLKENEKKTKNRKKQEVKEQTGKQQ